MQKLQMAKLTALGLITKHHLFIYYYIYLVNKSPVHEITHYYNVLTYSTGFLISPILAIDIPHFAIGVQK